MQEYIPSLIVGFVVVSSIAWIVLITRLSDINDRCSVVTVIIIMSLTSAITTCTVGLGVLGLWCAWNAGKSHAAVRNEAQLAMGNRNLTYRCEQTGNRVAKASYEDKDSGLWNETKLLELSKNERLQRQKQGSEEENKKRAMLTRPAGQYE